MMPGGDETQVQERELLENYAQFILNALEAILKENQTSLKYVRLLTIRKLPNKESGSLKLKDH